MKIVGENPFLDKKKVFSANCSKYAGIPYSPRRNRYQCSCSTLWGPVEIWSGSAIVESGRTCAFFFIWL